MPAAQLDGQNKLPVLQQPFPCTAKMTEVRQARRTAAILMLSNIMMIEAEQLVRADTLSSWQTFYILTWHLCSAGVVRGYVLGIILVFQAMTEGHMVSVGLVTQCIIPRLTSSATVKPA